MQHIHLGSPMPAVNLRLEFVNLRGRLLNTQYDLHGLLTELRLVFAVAAFLGQLIHMLRQSELLQRQLGT